MPHKNYTNKSMQTVHAQAHPAVSSSYGAPEVLQSCATYSQRHRNRQSSHKRSKHGRDRRTPFRSRSNEADV